ncbi:hypothetical protein EBO34_20305 [Alteribacter keqinensis]|uniref:Uncharacterized protein n=1 Tax=Alteribacter keqinensis TaxID=2483800 RepID=A0A3M7TP34_9BACI|nr:hypothetical protein EBO34_20305 [Alteribacter keqinensis]
MKGKSNEDSFVQRVGGAENRSKLFMNPSRSQAAEDEYAASVSSAVTSDEWKKRIVPFFQQGWQRGLTLVPIWGREFFVFSIPSLLKKEEGKQC